MGHDISFVVGVPVVVFSLAIAIAVTVVKAAVVAAVAVIFGLFCS